MTETNANTRTGYCGSGLTESDYWKLHREMRKQRVTPIFCEVCGHLPPHDLACVDKYEPDPENFRWMCRSCHLRYDFGNGTRTISEKTRLKMSETLRGRFEGENHPMFGKKLMEETKQKISDSLLDRKLTVEHRQKISEATSGEKHPLFGKRHTIEAKEKMCGPRPSISGEKNAFFGKTLSAIPRLRRKLALESRRYAKIVFMSGTFHVSEQEWMRNV
jgi:hypothetical protein